MLVSRAGLSPTMVGRRAELAQLRELAELAASRQEPVLAFVTAEAGIGKTRLLRELVNSAPPGTVAIAGQADERATARSFALVREVMHDEVRSWDALPAALEKYAHALSHLLDPWFPLPDHPADGHTHGPDELLRAATALVAHMAGAGPAIIAFDDLHWADPESMEFFTRLATTPGLPALVVGAFRPEDYQPGQPLARALETLGRQQDASEFALGCFAPPELRAFLEAVSGEHVSDAVVDALHERTRGNPFFVEELLQTALHSPDRGGDIWKDPAELGSAALPWTAAEAVRARLERLPPDDRNVVEVAAVLGRRFLFALLRRLVPAEEEDLLQACRRLVEAGVLIEQDADSFAFRHALTQEAVASRLLALERRRIHEQALAALEDMGEPCPARLAHHALGAGHTAKSRAYVRAAAGESLAEGAPRQALHFAQLGLSADADDPSLFSIAARAAAQVARLGQAADHAARWAALAQRAGAPADQCHAHCLQAWICWSFGDLDGAWSAVQAATAAAEASGSDEALARAWATRAQIHMLVGQPSESTQWADKALVHAERAGARAIRAHALVTKGTALGDLHADEEPEVVEEARLLLEEGRREAQEIGDVETVARAMHNLLMVGTGLVTAAEARELLDDARELADRYGLERFAAKIGTLAATLALHAGCRQGVEEALAECGSWSSAPIDRMWCATLEATLELESGDIAAASAALDAYWPSVEEIQDEQAQMDFAAAQAALAAATSDRQAGESALRRASAAVEHVNQLAAAVWWEVAIAALDAGVDPATVEELVQAAAPPRLARHAALIDHMEGVLHAASRRPQEAVAALERAVTRPQGSRAAPLLADAHLRLAELRLSAGEREAATNHARAAADLLSDWPGTRREAASRLLARLGGDPSASPGSLTVRELQVLELVTQGLSNREIAEQLFITQKTAATHVSNILSKTGLKSRTQAAAWAVKEGVVTLPLVEEQRV